MIIFQISIKHKKTKEFNFKSNIVIQSTDFQFYAYRQKYKNKDEKKSYFRLIQYV